MLVRCQEDGRSVVHGLSQKPMNNESVLGIESRHRLVIEQRNGIRHLNLIEFLEKDGELF